MLQQRLNSLRDFILRHNTYFNEGYANAVQDDTTGQVNNGDGVVFPADDKGPYFYLRLPNSLQSDYNREYIIADPAQSIGVKYDIILVACVPNADSGILLENMITTIGQYNEETLRISRMLLNPDDVLLQELKKIKKENIQAALQKLPENCGLCSVHFSFTIPFVFQPLKCIQSPCLNC